MQEDILKQRFNSHDRSYISYMSYESKKFYLQTTAKTASSWCNNKFGEPDNVSFEINTLKGYSNDKDLFNKDDSQQSKYIKDWNSLINGKSCKKDFVFLIRNPLEKVVTGFVQDVLLREVNESSPNSLLFQKYLLDLGYSQYEVTSFCNYYDPTFHEQKERGQINRKNFHTFPDVANFGPGDIFLPIFYTMIESLVDHWCNNIPRVINEVNHGHKMSNLIFVLKLLTFPPPNVDISKIHVMDINRQNIGESLNSKYGIKIKPNKMHAREPMFKHMVFTAFKKHLELLSAFLSTELTIYSEIINKLYPPENYIKGKKLPVGVFNAEDFLINDNMKNYHPEYLAMRPIDQNVLRQQFLAKTVDVESEISQVIQNIKNGENGSIESILRKQAEEDASITSSQFLVDNLF
jgi:hypothetical protein